AILIGYSFVLVPSLFVAHTVFFFGTLMPLLVLTYTGARRLHGRAFSLALLAPALLLAVVPIHQPGFDAGDYVFWLMLSTIAVGLGTLMRRLDGQHSALEATLAEQVRDQDLRERALLLDERARIARELHDVVAHAVSLMVVQAGASRLAVGFDDDEARTGLLAVESAGRDALVDLRRLLDVLRPDPEAVATSPTPGVAMLGELVTKMESAGLQVTLEISGEPAPLPAGLDLSLYRIVQEALTNTLKHAGPTGVTVRISYDDNVRVHIADDGPGERRGSRRRGATGHGLVGMRERAAVFGGTFQAGPQGEGWSVDVRLPIPDRHDALTSPAP
ncbi:MAG TPA: histidine kinase, partial [Mycobacteriales bacterium]|nr:histidine kinase [Mycobacteriales bacterium]